MPNVPRHPGRRFAIQTGIGLVMVAIGGLGYIIRNHFAQNPVHWLVGGAGAVALGVLLWRNRHHPIIRRLLGLLQAFFRRKKQEAPGNAPSADFDFDPADFDRGRNNDKPSSGGATDRGFDHRGGVGRPPVTPSPRAAPGKAASKPTEAEAAPLPIGMIRKLQDLRDDPKAAETERNNARALLERHVKSLKGKGARK